MIKIIAVILLVANIALFFLIQQQTAEENSRRIVPGGNIKLLSEDRQQIEIPKESEPTPETKVAIKEDSTPMLSCYRYGPLSSRLAAVGVLARLKETTSRLKIQREKPGTRYWALLPTSPEKTPSQIEQITTAGLKAPDLLTQGGLKGNLLLAVHSKHKNAGKLAERMQREGFTIKIDKKSSAATTYWVHFSSQDADFNPHKLGLTSTTTNLIKAPNCPQKRP